MELKDQIDPEKLPKHVAIIMDGNGRWAKEKGKLRTFGHQSGVTAVRETVEAAARIGIRNLTLYAFSTENWNRPKYEINALMQLLVNTINKEVKTLNENKIRLLAIGDQESLPKNCVKKLNEAIEDTSNNDHMNLVLALSYSSKWEIVKAIQQISGKVKSGEIDESDITESMIDQYLETEGIPDPELLIRTSGEYRISNFLLWQIAYAELYFTDKLWPDFRENDFYEAILDFQQRERRFGKTSEQIESKV